MAHHVIMREQATNYQVIKTDLDAHNNEPYLEIMEQPKGRGYRFRYECEGGSHGNIYGESTVRSKKTYPSVKIHNFSGAAKVTVTLVTDDNPPQPHTHELIGKDCHQGMCVIELKAGNSLATFSGLSIKHSTRKRAAEILAQRVTENLKTEKFSQLLNSGQHSLAVDIDKIEIPEEELKAAQKDAEARSRDINLSVVRLRFSAALREPNGNFFRNLNPIVSEPVYDAKSPGAAALKICRMDKSSGCCTGNEEVFLLCDKVQKEDISVCFQELDENGHVKWEAYGSFGPQDVHRQFAIVFRTPPYLSRSIATPVPVFVKLKRLTKEEVSNEVPFTYYPEQQDLEGIKHKRRKTLPHFGTDNGESFTGGFNRGGVYSPPGGTSGGGYSGVPSPHSGGMRVPIGPPVTTQIHSQGPQMKFAFPRAPVPQQQQQAQQAFPPQIQTLHTQVNTMPQLGSQFLTSVPFQFTGHQQSDPQHRQAQSMIPVQGQLLGRGITGGCSPRSVPSPSDQRVPERGPEQDRPTDLRTDRPTDLRTDRPTDLRTKIHTDCAGKTDSMGYWSSEGSLLASQGASIGGLKDVLPSPLLSDLNTKKTDDPEPKGKLPSQKICVKDTLKESELATDIFNFGERLFKALQDFATTGDVSYLLLVQRHLVAQQDDDGDNIIHLAVLYKKIHVLRDLLKVTSTLNDCGATNQANYLQQTPLHLATLIRDSQMVELLVTNGASLQAKDHQGNTALHLAARCHAPRCLQILLASAESPKLAGRPSPRSGPVSPEVNALNYEGLGPLHLAVMEGHLECVKLLLQRGRADANIQDGKSGKTPLHVAVDQNELAIVGYLAIEAKAEVNMPNFNGATALHVAVLDKKVGCVSILMASGADPDFEFTEMVPEDSESGEEDSMIRLEQATQNLSMKELRKQREEKERDFDEDKDIAEVDVEPDRGNREEGAVIYVTPRMLAEGNEKLEQLLNGEECTTPLVAPGGQFNLSEHMLELDPQTFGAVAATQRELRSGDSFKVQIRGDLNELDSMARCQLARLLDPSKPGSDWRELAHRVNLGDLVESIEMIASPTKAVLDNYEVLDGTMEKLAEALVKMQRPDAEQIVGNVLLMKAKVKVTANRGMMSHVGQLQSNFAAMNIKS